MPYQETPIEELRRMVRFYDCMNESFNMTFTIPELLRLWRFCCSDEGQHMPECPDTWTRSDVLAIKDAGIRRMMFRRFPRLRRTAP